MNLVAANYESQIGVELKPRYHAGLSVPLLLAVRLELLVQCPLVLLLLQACLLQRLVLLLLPLLLRVSLRSSSLALLFSLLFCCLALGVFLGPLGRSRVVRIGFGMP